MKTAATQRHPLWTGRSIVLLAIAASALNLRSAVTSLSPLLRVIGSEFDYGVGTIGLIGALPPACFAIFGACTPFLIRRMSLEVTAALAMTCTAIGVILRASSSSTGSLIVLSVLALAGMGVAGVVIPPLVREYFSDRLAAVSSVYLVVLHLGALVPALAAIPLSQLLGWRVATGAWGLVAASAGALWVGSLRRGRRPKNDNRTEQVAPGKLTRGQLRVYVWRSPTVWNLTVLFGLASGNVFILFSWLPTLVSEAGYSASFGGTMVAAMITVSMLIGIFAPSLTVKLRNPMPLVEGCAVAFAAGYAGLAVSPQDFTILWVVLLGAGSSLFIVAQTMINTHSTTLAGSAVTSSQVQSVGGAIAVLGPVAFGALHAWTGSWPIPYAFVAATLLGIAITGFRERHHVTFEDDADVRLSRVP